MSKTTETVIHLHREAPHKPQFGAPCNGCGVCCALETCPLARLRFFQKRGPCPALTWSDGEKRYSCGLLTEPQRLVPAAPRRLYPLLQRSVRRWIAAGAGCDCQAELRASPR